MIAKNLGLVVLMKRDGFLVPEVDFKIFQIQSVTELVGWAICGDEDVLKRAGRLKICLRGC